MGAARLSWACLVVLAACSSATRPTTPTAVPDNGPAAPGPANTRPPPPQSATPRRRVIIISEDGLAADVLSSLITPTHLGFMRQSLTARVAHTVEPSETLPAHASMLSGVPPDVHGMTWDAYKPGRGYITVPTVFSLAHAAGKVTAMLYGKTKLEHLATPGTLDLAERPGFLCAVVARRAVEVLTTAPPDLLFLHFANADDAGHAHGWRTAAYQLAVAESDRCVATVLAAVDALGLAATTYVLITADHGGHGRSHSARDERVRAIPWMLRGPGIEPGIIDADVSTMDTAATVLELLDLPRPVDLVGVSRLPTTMR